MEVAWTSRKYCIRQGSAVCSGNDEGAKPLIGNLNKTLNGLLPSNRWADGKDKLGVGTVSESLH